MLNWLVCIIPFIVFTGFTQGLIGFGKRFGAFTEQGAMHSEYRDASRSIFEAVLLNHYLPKFIFNLMFERYVKREFEENITSYCRKRKFKESMELFLSLVEKILNERSTIREISIIVLVCRYFYNFDSVRYHYSSFRCRSFKRWNNWWINRADTCW